MRQGGIITRFPVNPSVMMHFDGVLLMGICDKIQQERLEYLRIQFFLDVLGFSLNGGSNPYEVFFELLNKGLTLHYTESGDEFDEKKIEFNGDVKTALTRVEELLESDLLASKAFKNEKVKNQDGLEISVGDLLVKGRDIERIYAEYGETQYPWSLAAWPTNSNEWLWLPVNKGEDINKNESAPAKTSPKLHSPNKAINDWEIPHPDDPTPRPAESWYTAARYFAREFISADKSLRNPNKTNLLAGKVVKKLEEKKIKPSRKRDQSERFADSTVKKAFYGVDLSKKNPT